MSRSPPRLAVYPGYPPQPLSSNTSSEHSPSKQHPHRPALHSPYVQPGPPAPHRTDHDPYFRPYHGDPRYIYRPYHLPVRPHPPAPPTPPRVHHVHQHFREAYPLPDSPDARPHLLSAYNYYRDKAQYEAQHHPSPPSERCASSRSDPEGLPCLSDSGSKSGPSGPDDAEPTPSPVDLERIQQWEDQQSRARSRYTSSGSPSLHDDDADEGDDVIDPSLTDSSYRVRSVGEHDVQEDGTVEETKDLDEKNLPPPPQRDVGIDPPTGNRQENSAYYPSAHHQVQFKALAEKHSMLDPGEEEMNLNSLVDAESNERPSYSIPIIIRCAILGSPHKQLTLSELYTAMEIRFPYYRHGDKKSWRNSVRHNLSLNNQFDKKPRPITEPGKGHYWVVATGRPQGNKRERKRNKKLGKRALAALAAAEAEKAHALAAEQRAIPDPDLSVSAYAPPELNPIPIDPQLLDMTTALPPTLRASQTGTLPANAGSYAAVTGALPLPAPIDPSMLRLWDGNATSPSALSEPPRTGSVESTLPAQQRTATRRSTRGAQSRARSNPPNNEGPQFGLPSLPPPTFGPPPQRENTPNTSVASVSSTDSSSSSAGGVHRTASKRAQRRYDPTTVPSRPAAAPQNAFTALAAQLERDGTGATGSGGPALTARSRRNRVRRIPVGDDHESEDGDLPSGDDEYMPDDG